MSMTTQPDCACDTIWSPQMEYTPGTHHDREQCPLWQPSVGDDLGELLREERK